MLSASLTGLARAFRRLAVAARRAEHRVADAIRPHPEWVSGTRRDERALLTAVPGAIGKAGAEGCYAVALPDGRAFALKTDDGAPRVRPVLMAEACGVRACRRAGVDADLLRDGWSPSSAVASRWEIRQRSDPVGTAAATTSRGAPTCPRAPARDRLRP